MATKKTTKTKTPAAETTTPAATTQPNISTDEKCVWQIGTPCGGETTQKEFFNHQIRIPVCGNHLNEHREIMVLHKNGYDVEEILNQTPEWRKQEVLTLELSGLETGNVEL